MFINGYFISKQSYFLIDTTTYRSYTLQCKDGAGREQQGSLTSTERWTDAILV